MLDLSRYTYRDEEFRSYGYTGLADLSLMVCKSCIYGST